MVVQVDRGLLVNDIDEKKKEKSKFIDGLQ